jgi:hypothetical protein
MPPRRKGTKAKGKAQRKKKHDGGECEHLLHEDDRYEGEYIFSTVNAGADLYRNVRDQGGVLSAVRAYATEGFKCPGCEKMHLCGRLAYLQAEDCGIREAPLANCTVVYCKFCKTSIGVY